MPSACGTWMLRVSLGAAEPELASTLTSPPPGPDGDETKDQRLSAVRVTPNGSPGTRDIVTSAAGRRGPCAVAVLQRGLPLATVSAVDAGMLWGGDA